MNSLRQELMAVPGLPTMRMLLPAGWRARELSEDGLAVLVGELREIFMQAHRPDLDAELTSMLENWARQLRENGGRYAILPAGDQPGAVLPMSMTVSVVTQIGGADLDTWVTAKITSGGTRFLDEQRTVLAWHDERREQEGVFTDLHSYLIPVPGTRRQQALLLAGTHLSLAGDGATPERREMAEVLFDTMALALDWVPAS